MKTTENLGGTNRPVPVLETKSVRVQGERLDVVLRFLGIPYAQSIAGKNRFAPPRPLEP